MNLFGVDTLYLLTLLFFLFTCETEPVQNPPDVSQNTAEEDQVVVENGIETLMDCLEVLETGDFSNLLIDLYDNVDDDSNDFSFITNKKSKGKIF